MSNCAPASLKRMTPTPWRCHQAKKCMQASLQRCWRANGQLYFCFLVNEYCNAGFKNKATCAPAWQAIIIGRGVLAAIVYVFSGFAYLVQIATRLLASTSSRDPLACRAGSGRFWPLDSYLVLFDSAFWAAAFAMGSFGGLRVAQA